MKLTKKQLRNLIKESIINEGYFTDYAKHSTMNLGQVLRHLRYLTDLPNTPKREALKKRLKWIANDLYYTVIPPQSHHTQEELDFQDQFSYGELLKMGYDPDYFDEMMANAERQDNNPPQGSSSIEDIAIDTETFLIDLLNNTPGNQMSFREAQSLVMQETDDLHYFETQPDALRDMIDHYMPGIEIAINPSGPNAGQEIIRLGNYASIE